MLVIRYAEVEKILSGRESVVIDIVRQAYLLHSKGESAVPPSVFLRFPGDQVNRIIALPAFVGGESPAAGVKWIASFPRNSEHGIARASAAILLNSLTTGHPAALIEGSVISAGRTAASAVLAASILVGEPAPRGAAFIGCGVINHEVLRFLAATWPALTSVTVQDTDASRAAWFGRRARALAPGADFACAADARSALAAQRLVFIATTAATPHLDLAGCDPDQVIIHLSLRDIVPDSILSSQNVVDDRDHACREGTSLQLAEQAVGHRHFIDASIGQLLDGSVALRPGSGRPVIFSPFGLGALDIALAGYVHAQAARSGLGTEIDGFLPASPGLSA